MNENEANSSAQWEAILNIGMGNAYRTITVNVKQSTKVEHRMTIRISSILLSKKEITAFTKSKNLDGMSAIP
jgi:hypothetical protein